MRIYGQSGIHKPLEGSTNTSIPLNPGPKSERNTPEVSSPPKRKSDAASLGLLTSSVLTTGLATLTHLKEDIAGGLTKTVKVAATFATMFLWTMTLATLLSGKDQSTRDISLSAN